ncbi:MAG TPA: hypothetical protein VGP36_11330 [Mycobacteriales bacterium]|nr:hypothetical protein [Mycobacteriales bacterium]
MGDVAYGWIGTAPGNAPADRAEQAPSLVVSAAHSALGAVTRLQVRVGDVSVLLSPTATGWERAGVADELDVGAHLAARLDLVGRGGEVAPERWAGSLPVSRYAAFRTADPADAETLARAAGCPPALVRALARPVAVSRVEVVRRDGAARGTGPTTVVTDELAWVDGGEDGLWTVRPGGPDEVEIGRGTPDEVAVELAGLVRAAEGC